MATSKDILERELNRRRGVVDTKLRGRIDTSPARLDQTREGIETGREQLFADQVRPSIDDIGSRLGIDFGGAGEAAIGREKGRLTTRLNTNLAGRGRRDRVSTLRDIFQTELRRAETLGLNEADARRFASAVTKQKIRQQFEAEEAQKDRLSATKRENISDDFLRRGLDQEIEFEPQNQFEAAALRSLFGLTTSVGTSLALNRRPRAPEQQTSSKSSIFPKGTTTIDRLNVPTNFANV